jgi:REP element-mobilizing transposase RayT
MPKTFSRSTTYAPTDHGGPLRNTRNGRGARALTTRHTMHLVLRSSKAKGAQSLTRGDRRRRITQLVYKHAARNHIHMLSFANVGNHLHLHIQLRTKKTVNIRGETQAYNHRQMYCRFIRAITGAIALMIATAGLWDQRPFTRYVTTQRHFINMRDYMEINKLEGRGFHRINARLTIAFRFDQKNPPEIDDS